MKIAIVGAGALGGLFGGRLAATGEDVHLYDVWEEHVRAIQRDGLEIESATGLETTVHPPATTSPAEIGVSDVVFVFTKSFDTRQAIVDAEPLIDEETVVVTLQNGLDNVDVVREFVPSERILGGTTLMGSTVSVPGRIHHDGNGKTKLGGPASGTAETLASKASEAGMPTDTVDDPLPYIWDKQFVSVCSKPMAALTHLDAGTMGELPETNWLVERLVREATDVARAKDIEFVSEDPVEEVRETLLAHPGSISSMLEDVRKERPTEIDSINGAIVRYGHEEGVDVTVNEALTNLVKAKEQSYL